MGEVLFSFLHQPQHLQHPYPTFATHPTTAMLGNRSEEEEGELQAALAAFQASHFHPEQVDCFRLLHPVPACPSPSQAMAAGAAAALGASPSTTQPQEQCTCPPSSTDPADPQPRAWADLCPPCQRYSLAVYAQAGWQAEDLLPA